MSIVTNMLVLHLPLFHLIQNGYSINCISHSVRKAFLIKTTRCIRQQSTMVVLTELDYPISKSQSYTLLIMGHYYNTAMCHYWDMSVNSQYTAQ